jgi:hypothetical protein
MKVLFSRSKLTLIQEMSQMLRNIFAMPRSVSLMGIAIATAITTTSFAVHAQPQPDNRGNFRNVNWQSWRVVDRDPKGLNCRQGPGTNYNILRRLNFLRQITPLSSPEVKLDRDSNPWVEVMIDNNQSCFVRSHSAFILPSWDFYQQN